MTLLILSLVILGVSTVGVVVDATINRIASSSDEYSFGNGALAWALGCLLLWVVVFPAYLFKRHREMKHRGEIAAARLGSGVGLATFASMVLVIVWPLIFEQRLSTEELQAKVLDSIRTTWAKNAALQGVHISKFTLIHKTGNEYDGAVECDLGSEHSTLLVDVTYDGRNFVWKLH